MYKAGENQKCTERHQTELEHLIVISAPYTLNTYPWGPNFGLFCSTISRFRDTTCTRWVKIGNAPNDPKLNLEHLTVESTPYTLNTYPWGPNFGLIRSTISRFWDRTLCKVKENRKCTEWPQTGLEYLTVKGTLYIYTVYLSRRPKFWSVSLYD